MDGPVGEVEGRRRVDRGFIGGAGHDAAAGGAAGLIVRPRPSHSSSRPVPPAVPELLVANWPVKLVAAVLKLSKAVAPIVNVLETAVAREPSEAVRVYMPLVATARVLKVATPPTACALTVLPPPVKVPPLRVSVTVDVSPGSVLPAESSTATVTAGLMFVPLVVGSAAA